MDKPSQKAQAVLKLLNTLGRKTIKEDFGLDLTFEFVSEDYVPMIGGDESFQVKVRTDPPIEEVTYVENQSWGPRKFLRPTAITVSLDNLGRYIGFNDNLLVRVTNISTTNYRVFDVVDITEREDDFYIMKSVGTVLHIPTGLTFPYSKDNTVDYYEGTYLEFIDNQEWWDSLSGEDKQALINFYKKR